MNNSYSMRVCLVQGCLWIEIEFQKQQKCKIRKEKDSLFSFNAYLCNFCSHIFVIRSDLVIPFQLDFAFSFLHRSIPRKSIKKRLDIRKNIERRSCMWNGIISIFFKCLIFKLGPLIAISHSVLFSASFSHFFFFLFL